MKFSELAAYFERIEGITARLEITTILAELFGKLSPDEMEKTAYLLQGRVAPLFVKSDFGMQDKMVAKGLCAAFQVDKEAFDAELKRRGDLGATVEYFRESMNTMHQGDPDVAEVYERLKSITTTVGEGSQEAKQKILAALVMEVDPRSARYAVRIPTGVVRLGFSDMTVLDAYSWMITGDKSLRKRIENAYHVRPDLGFIGRTLKEQGIDAIDEVKPALFTPILMMRAERMSSGAEIVERMGPAAIEPKFDGFRLQCHYSRKENRVALYTRGLESVADTYPDVIEGITKELDVDEVIIEGEAIGFVPETEEFLPFQETVQRKRKHGVEEKAKEIPLKLFTFELLYMNGKSYIDEPYTLRREKIEEIIRHGSDVQKGTILASSSVVLDDAEDIEHAFEDATTRGLEGIMAKKLDGVYQAGARGLNWVKFKRSYSSSAIDDTIDCVVMGYDIGKGKRAEFGIGAFLVGVYDEKADAFLTVAKIGTGLTDDEWREMKIRCDRLSSEGKPASYDVDNRMSVDVWVKPEIVVEIRADEITRSPMHTAGRTLKPSKSGKAMEVDVAGYALRFPRLEKFRDDKRKEEATTVKEVEDLFARAKK
jgi:DNA ligase-1